MTTSSISTIAIARPYLRPLLLGSLLLTTACAATPGTDSSAAGGTREPARSSAASTTSSITSSEAVKPTREFEIRGDHAYLGGEPVVLWGLRCGNALYSATVTERHVRALDEMVAHGINTIGVYVQGSNGGWPDADAGLNGYRRDGSLKPDVARRLEWLVREADRRGMVVMVGLFSPRKDQEFEGPDAVRRAIEETATFLVERGLKNVFVDLMHEYDHTERADLDLFREPDGADKKARMTRWFKAKAPDVEVGVCPYEKSPTTDTYPGMEVRIIQKSMAIPTSGFVVNVESQKQDSYENDGVFGDGQREYVLADCERYQKAPNAGFLFHAAYIQGIGNFSGTAPHPEMGGLGTGPGDRGVRIYFDWVRDHVGRWEFPRHVPVGAASPVASTSGLAATSPQAAALVAQAVPVGSGDASVEPVATREFEVRGGLPFLGGEPVKLWGMRCNNALMSPAVTQRLIGNLDNMAACGFNLISVALQGTNGGFPDVNAGPNAFTPDGRLIPAFQRRLEAVVRAADQRGMVVCIGVAMPRKDELLRDEEAVLRAIREVGRFLEARKLRNVMVCLFHEFNHPTRIDHEIFREPDGATKKARLTQVFKAVAPEIEVGIVSNHLTSSSIEYPGCDVLMMHEEAPIPAEGFVLNAESPEEDQQGNEGVFNSFARARVIATLQKYAASPRLAMLFRSPYVEDVRGRQGTGPNFEMGGDGKGESDRGIRFVYEWMKTHVGAWRYPRHVSPK